MQRIDGPMALDPTTARLLNGRDVIVFDGECVLCSRFFHFMLRRDRQERFAFAQAQAPLGQSLYHALNLPLDDFETNLVILDGRVFTKMAAFAVAMSVLGWPWRWLAALRFFPKTVSEPLYHLIARNRYRIFGRYDSCMMPTPDVRSRFLPGGLL